MSSNDFFIVLAIDDERKIHLGLPRTHSMPISVDMRLSEPVQLAMLADYHYGRTNPGPDAESVYVPVLLSAWTFSDDCVQESIKVGVLLRQRRRSVG